MSTIHEVITAKHCGMSALAFSLITNACILEEAESANDGEGESTDLANEVFQVASQSETVLKEFVSRLVRAIGVQLNSQPI